MVQQLRAGMEREVYLLQQNLTGSMRETETRVASSMDLERKGKLARLLLNVREFSSSLGLV